MIPLAESRKSARRVGGDAAVNSRWVGGFVVVMGDGTVGVLGGGGDSGWDGTGKSTLLRMTWERMRARCWRVGVDGGWACGWCGGARMACDWTSLLSAGVPQDGFGGLGVAQSALDGAQSSRRESAGSLA